MEFLLQTTHLLPKTDPLSLAGLKPELLRQRLQQRLRHLDASPARLTAAMPLLGRLGCLGRGRPTGNSSQIWGRLHEITLW